MEILSKLLILFLFILTAISCKKEGIEIYPQKAILGKWEITRNSFGPVQAPVEYEEFLPDSVLLIYNYESKTVFKGKYWFADSILYKQHVYVDQVTNDTLLIDLLPYKYHFPDNNTLELDFQYLAMNTRAFYKRIK